MEEEGSAPSFGDLIEYVKEKAEGKFGTRGSLGFPGIFDIATGQVDLSRHSVSHGVADRTKYTRSKAIQAILILDQMYFYMA